MFRILCISILAALPFSASIALEPQQQTGKNQVVLEEAGETVLASKLSATFQGCTVEDAFAFIAKALDEKINVVVHPSAKDIAIPDFSVKRASALMIANLLCNLVLDLDIKMSETQA